MFGIFLSAVFAATALTPDTILDHVPGTATVGEIVKAGGGGGEGGHGIGTNEVRSIINSSFDGGTNAVNEVITNSYTKEEIDDLLSNKLNGPTDTDLYESGRAADAEVTGEYFDITWGDMGVLENNLSQLDSRIDDVESGVSEAKGNAQLAQETADTAKTWASAAQATAEGKITKVSGARYRHIAVLNGDGELEDGGIKIDNVVTDAYTKAESDSMINHTKVAVTHVTNENGTAIFSSDRIMMIGGQSTTNSVYFIFNDNKVIFGTILGTSFAVDPYGITSHIVAPDGTYVRKTTLWDGLLHQNEADNLYDTKGSASSLLNTAKQYADEEVQKAKNYADQKDAETIESVNEILTEYGRTNKVTKLFTDDGSKYQDANGGFWEAIGVEFIFSKVSAGQSKLTQVDNRHWQGLFDFEQYVAPVRIEYKETSTSGYYYLEFYLEDMDEWIWAGNSDPITEDSFPVYINGYKFDKQVNKNMHKTKHVAYTNDLSATSNPFTNAVQQTIINLIKSGLLKLKVDQDGHVVVNE